MVGKLQFEQIIWLWSAISYSLSHSAFSVEKNIATLLND